MLVKFTTRIEVTDEVGKHIVTIERTREREAGGNPRFFVSEVMERAQGNTEEAVILAAKSVDTARSANHA